MVSVVSMARAMFHRCVHHIMAARACGERRGLYWSRRTESILDHPPFEG
jgi:hypothetical protein